MSRGTIRRTWRNIVEEMISLNHEVDSEIQRGTFESFISKETKFLKKFSSLVAELADFIRDDSDAELTNDQLEREYKASLDLALNAKIHEEVTGY